MNERNPPPDSAGAVQRTRRTKEPKSPVKNWECKQRTPVRTTLATSVCQLRHDQMEQGPTEPHAGRSTFLLSSGGAGGGYY